VPIEAARVRFESITFDSLPDSVRHVTRAAEAWWDDEELTMFPIDAVARQCVDFERRLEQEKLEALAEFAAGAGHEINNPLAVISGRAQLLLQDETDHDRRQDLAMIHAQARRVHEMIAGLMLFARPPQANRTPVEVGSLISEVIDAYSDNIPGDPQPRLCLPAEEAWVLADALLLKQSLGALLDNAREATPAGETPAICVSVEVGDSVRGRVVRIAVQDQGVGITVTARRHMFDPFYSGRQAGRGLGVGLSKCWRIVTSHGGQLEVASDGQRGAIISIELPAVDGTQASDPAH
jgi:signal transduction histidine kinase